MSKNQNRNQQQQQKPAAQPPATPPQQSQEGQQPPNQEDQAQQDNASQGAGNEQQSNDQAAQDQAEKQTPVQEPAKKPSIVDAAPLVHNKKEGFTPVLKVQLDLTNYAEAMDKKKSIVPQEGGKWQYSLFTTLKDVLNAKDQAAFNSEWNTALMFFHKEKDGIFNENFLFRFPAEWPGSATEFTLFRRLVYMMIQTANPKTRKAELGVVNLELVVEGLNQNQRTKLLNFYEA